VPFSTRSAWAGRQLRSFSGQQQRLGYPAPYGTDFATQCANIFWANRKDYFGIYFEHQLYCGHGLAWVGNNLILSEVWDGILFPQQSIMKWSVQEKVQFIHWLSQQSDFSLSGEDKAAMGLYTDDKWAQGNQRLSHARIARFMRENAQPPATP
jgi:hypothetical protein